MRILARSFSLGLTGWLAAQAGALAQAAPSVATPPVVQTQTEGAAAGVTSDARKQAEDPTVLDYLFNKKPQNGTFGKEGDDAANRLGDKIKALDALNTPGFEDKLMRARFETYLSEPEIPTERVTAYLALYKETNKLLQAGDLKGAWQKLSELAEYTDLDAGISQELANRVEAVWDAGFTTQSLHRNNRQLQEKIEDQNYNADVMAEGLANSQAIKPGATPRSVPKGSPGGATPTIDPNNPTVGHLQLAEEYLKSLGDKTQIKLNDAQIQILIQKSKSDFGDYVGTLFATRRHLHVVLAANFYLKLFNEGDYPVTMANEVNGSLEILQAVNQAVSAFRYQIAQNQVAGATDRLQQAFLASELHPALKGLERTQKEKVAKYAHDMIHMQNMIEARDFANLDTLLNQLKETASDFDDTKPRALVNAVKLQSQMHLGKAKLAAQMGHLPEAMEEFQSASEAWPANPALANAMDGFFTSQDLGNRSKENFDRLYQEGSFRKIYSDQLIYATAVKDDVQRSDELKTALTKVKNAEIASEKANILSHNGDQAGAWEAVYLALKDWPEDAKLNNLQSTLATQSLFFVNALQKAQGAEARNDYGYSLSLYVDAQRLYPASQIAIAGVERISKLILDSSLSKN
jgi:hypothetical protein